MGDVEQVADNVDNLINIFRKHLFRSNHGINAFTLLVERLNKFYNKEIDLDVRIREKILNFLLNIRVNPLGQVALTDNSSEAIHGMTCAGTDTYLASIDFSPFVLCLDHYDIDTDEKGASLSPPTSPNGQSNVGQAFSSNALCMNFNSVPIDPLNCTSATQFIPSGNEHQQQQHQPPQQPHQQPQQAPTTTPPPPPPPPPPQQQPEREQQQQHQQELIEQENENEQQQTSLPQATSSSGAAITSSTATGEVKFQYLDLNEVFKVVLKCLQTERDWQVVKMVLHRLRLLLINNPTIFKFTRYPKNVTEESKVHAADYGSNLPGTSNHRTMASNLVKIACEMIMDRKYFESLTNLDAVDRTSSGSFYSSFESFSLSTNILKSAVNSSTNSTAGAINANVTGIPSTTSGHNSVERSYSVSNTASSNYSSTNSNNISHTPTCISSTNNNLHQSYHLPSVSSTSSLTSMISSSHQIVTSSSSVANSSTVTTNNSSTTSSSNTTAATSSSSILRGNKFGKDEFDLHVYPLLEAFIIHGKTLEPEIRCKLVKTIASGLQNRHYIKQTLCSLTFCMMEMQDPKMVKLFPTILLEITKISSTKPYALPKLNFLSNLILFPKLYSNFNHIEYFYIFAIAVPYTNYPVFDEFTVALAHRVVAMWFLTCKLSYRREVFQYIYTNLVVNCSSGAEEHRNRSQSLGTSIGKLKSPDASLARPPQTPNLFASTRNPNSPSSFSTHSANPTFFFSESHISSGSKYQQQSQVASNSLTQSALAVSSSSSTSNSLLPNHSTDYQIQKELFETCIDLLSRYTYGSCSSVPPNHPYAHLLVDRTTAKTWLVGQSTITIATSGCQSRVFTDGLCRKCHEMCKPFGSCTPSDGSVSAPVIPHERRRHKSDVQRLHSSSGNSYGNPLFSNGGYGIYGHGNNLHGRSRDDSHLSSIDSGPSGDAFRSGSATCSCWCQGWAEIVFRRPTGKISSLIRLTNSLSLPSPSPNDLLNFYDPSILSYNCTAIFEPIIDDVLDDCNFGSTSSSSNETTVANPPEHRSLDSSQVESKESADPDATIDVGVEPLCTSPTVPSKNVSASMADAIDHSNIFNSNESTSGTSGIATASSSSSSVFSSSSVSSVNSGTIQSNTTATGSNINSNCNNNTNTNSGPNSSSKLKVTRAQSLGQGDRSRLSPDKNHRGLTIPLSFGTNDPSAFTGHPNTSTAPPILSSRNIFDPALTDSSANSNSSSILRQRSHTVSGQNRHALHSTNLSLTGHGTFGSNTFISNPPTGFNDAANTTKVYGITPSFVFLQFYHHTTQGADKAILLSKSETISRAIRTLDHISPFETHKIGIVYVAIGQEKSKIEILANEAGSNRYHDMLVRIGNLQRLRDVDEATCFIGGLDKSGSDGKFVVCWHDNLTQVVFHVATLMPTDRAKDEQCTRKFRHIGNDHVVIVYNDSGQTFNKSTLAGDFLRFCIVVTPLDCNLNYIQFQTDQGEVLVKCNNSRRNIVPSTESAKLMGHGDSFMISDENLPLYIRQMAIHANLMFNQIHNNKGAKGVPFISNWVERLRKLKSLREKAIEEDSEKSREAGNRNPSDSRTRPVPLVIHDYPDDFTKYTS